MQLLERDRCGRFARPPRSKELSITEVVDLCVVSARLVGDRARRVNCVHVTATQLASTFVQKDKYAVRQVVVPCRLLARLFFVFTELC
jgi:hypothetical protein